MLLIALDMVARNGPCEQKSEKWQGAARCAGAYAAAAAAARSQRSGGGGGGGDGGGSSKY